MTTSLITAEEFKQVLREGMPSGQSMPLEVLELERGRAVLRVQTGPNELRPGGIVAGPVTFWFADLAMFAAVLSVVGKQPLAVTTDATIHFLRPPRVGVLVARASVLKEGKRLVVGDVHITQDDDVPLVHAVMTYSVPPGPGPGR